MKKRNLRLDYLLVVALSLTFMYIVVDASSEPLLPPTNTEVIIAGVAHTASLLKSGKGHFKHYGHAYFEEKKEIIDEKREVDPSTGTVNAASSTRSVEAFEFAFSNKYSYFKSANGEVISDGKVQLIIPSPQNISASYGNFFPPFPLNPRDRGLWYQRQELSDYLYQHKEAIRLVGNETVDGVRCYVLEMPDSRVSGTTLTFWIAPDGGFRLIQSLHARKTEKTIVKIQWQQWKTEKGDAVWFPRHSITLFTREGQKTPLRNEGKITDFQPNIDVSHLFDLQISPETRIMNTDIGKLITFKELGWRTFQTHPSR